MVTMRASVPSSSPHVYGSSPYSLSHILDQHHNQCVPGSPSLSPFFRHAALPQTMLTRNSSPGTAQVPESAVTETISNSAGYSNGSRVYTGSPLLRQILRVGRKRQFEGESCSPLAMSSSTTPSPIAQSSKRARIESPAMRVPSSVIVTERRTSHLRTQAKGLEQVVPAGLGSPLDVGGSCSEGRKETKGWTNVCQRSLPTSKEGMRQLDLFTGDEIFANHEE